MARYGKSTSLPPRQVLRLAREQFGPDGELGLPVSREAEHEVAFEGGGGGVAVAALLQPGTPGATDVTILSREYDFWAEQFLSRLPNA